MTEPSPSRLRVEKLLPWVVVALGVAAYANTLGNDFIFDDTAFLTGAYAIRSWQDAADILFSSRRWLPNLTFGLNWLVGGTEPAGYHLVNLVIHALAGATLYGVVRRAARSRWTTAAVHPPSAIPHPPSEWLAFAVALLWTLHPLATQAVTYTVQRHESMMGLFYLLTLYGTARIAEAERDGGPGGGQRWPWIAATTLACAAGMASKEVMLTAPVVALLYDRAFFAGSFARCLFRARSVSEGTATNGHVDGSDESLVLHLWRGRAPLYVLLALTWLLLLAGGVSDVAVEGGSAGFGLATLTWWQYLLSQAEVILWYLRLSILPWPLVLDYMWPPAWIVVQEYPQRLWVEIVLPVAAVGGLLAASLYGLARNHAWGFPAFAAFAVLSITSSVIPIGDLAVEHRMYLPLAAVVALAVLAAWRLLAAVAGEGAPRIAAALLAIVAVILAGLTVQRNAEYATSVTIWRTVAERAPTNPRAFHNYGEALQAYGQLPAAIEAYRESIRRHPTFADSYHNLGQALLETGDAAGAVRSFQRAAELQPDDAATQRGLANALLAAGDAAAAESAARRATELSPLDARPWNTLGVALAKQGRGDEAIAAFEKAISLDEGSLEALRNLANELVRAGRLAEAAAVAERTVGVAESLGVDPRVVAQMREGARQLRQMAQEQGPPQP